LVVFLFKDYADGPPNAGKWSYAYHRSDEQAGGYGPVIKQEGYRYEYYCNYYRQKKIFMGESRIVSAGILWPFIKAAHRFEKFYEGANHTQQQANQ